MKRILFWGILSFLILLAGCAYTPILYAILKVNGYSTSSILGINYININFSITNTGTRDIEKFEPTFLVIYDNNEVETVKNFPIPTFNEKVLIGETKNYTASCVLTKSGNLKDVKPYSCVLYNDSYGLTYTVRY